MDWNHELSLRIDMLVLGIRNSGWELVGLVRLHVIWRGGKNCW